MTILQHSIAQAAAATGYQIARSLRFNSADSANLSRTFAAAPTVKTKQTISCWVKRSAVGVGQAIFSGYDGSSAQSTSLYFTSGDLLAIDIGGLATNSLITTQVFRDPSAFFHLHVEIDTTQATASNRVKMYANGQQITAFGTANYPAQNAVTQFALNNANNKIGSGWNNGAYLSAYLTDLFFIDGQALTPSSFGETNANTGVWVPKTYAGTFGTNGFWLKFDDNSAATAAALGKDSSGNSNNWTPNNFSVTAGAGNDSLVDSPTNYGTDTGAGGEVRGNYATLNPLKNAGSALSNGNLDQASAVNNAMVLATIGMQSGKWYWEVSGGTVYGIAQDNVTLANYIGQNANSWGYHQAGTVYTNAASTAYGNTWTGTDVIGIAFDADNGRLLFSKNGVWQNSGNPAAGTNPAYSSLTNGPYFPAVQANSGATAVSNFGQRPFAYTAPSGFKALCTQNLPIPTVGATSTTLADDYFNVVTYTGTGSSLSVTGVGFQPDFVWVKGRSGATDHALYDAVRGVQKQLESNTTTAETTETTGLTAFGTDGFTVGSLAQVNTNAATYVGWAWKANGAGVSNTAGSLTSTVSANQTAGISVVTYTIPSASATIETFGHGLGKAPSMVILKVRGNVDEWTVYNANLTTPLSNWLTLNTTAAAGGATSTFSSSSTTFGVRGTRLLGSGTSGNIVAYCFAEIAGFSRFGSYTGNGNADGPFVYCGFRPRFVLIKVTSTTENWTIFDTARDTFNFSRYRLHPSLINEEGVGTEAAGNIAIDILSNGFKLRNTSTNINGSAQSYIFAAFAESPFNYARAR